MRNHSYDVAVIGAGPAGLAAAGAAIEAGAENVVIIERDFRPGGILEQCIHVGFGLKYFKEELTGPEYAARFIAEAKKDGVTFFLNTMVLSISEDGRQIRCINSEEGDITLEVKSVVLSMGCRERTRTAIQIPGTRPAGIFTAGTAQRYINIQNLVVGKEVVILGSGDIGMIMARRMTLENVKVKAVVELMPYLAGLTRNRVQCLDDFGIPLYLSHTITDIQGKKRVEGVTVAKVDEKGKPVAGTEFNISCDTVLLSVGLIPENEVSKTCGVTLDPVTKGPIVDNTMQTSVKGVFACGNVVHVNDLVDNVSVESRIAGAAAARFARERHDADDKVVTVNTGENVRYVVPQKIDLNSGVEKVEIHFRVRQPDRGVIIQAVCGEEIIHSHKCQIVNPGEITSVKVDLDKIRNGNADEITVRVIKEGNDGN